MHICVGAAYICDVIHVGFNFKIHSSGTTDMSVLVLLNPKDGEVICFRMGTCSVDTLYFELSVWFCDGLYHFNLMTILAKTM